MTVGTDLIAKERVRQLTQEQYLPIHDKQWVTGELALAGVHYAFWAIMTYRKSMVLGIDEWFTWPWLRRYYKPKSYVKDLIRAGTLIAAELDRLSALGQLKGEVDEKPE